MSGISHYHAYAKGRNSSALGGSLEQIFLSVSFHIGDRDKIIWGFALLLLLNHSAVSHSTEGSTPGFPVLHNLPAFAQTHVHWVSDAIQPSHPLSPTSLALNLSSIRVFSSESALCNRWPKYWSFSFSISSSNKDPGLSSLRIECFDLTVYETLKSLLQYHSSKASIIFYLNLFILIGA